MFEPGSRMDHGMLQIDFDSVPFHPFWRIYKGITVEYMMKPHSCNYKPSYCTSSSKRYFFSTECVLVIRVIFLVHPVPEPVRGRTTKLLNQGCWGHFPWGSPQVEVTVWLCPSPTLVYYWAVYPCISQNMGWCKMTPKWLRGWCKMLFVLFFLGWPAKTSNTIFLWILCFYLWGVAIYRIIRIPITSLSQAQASRQGAKLWARWSQSGLRTLGCSSQGAGGLVWASALVTCSCLFGKGILWKTV